MAGNPRRGTRTTALTCGLIAEVGMGGTLLVWSGTATPLGREALGATGSVIALGSAMALLAVGMAALLAGARRGILRAAVFAVALAAGVLGVVAFSALVQAPGTGILLVLSWGMTIPVILGLTRASARAPHSRER